jgi:hypothetical protein
MNKITYSELPVADKLLMDDLFKYKDKLRKERGIVRDIICDIRKIEKRLTADIMNLSQKEISEKFELATSTAKPMDIKDRRKAEDLNNAITR